MLRRWRVQLLAALTALAVANYCRWGPETITQQEDAYDLLHYYVNAKYFFHLGYFDLYPAMMLVDHENGGPFFKEGPTYMAQDPTGDHFAPVSQALERGQEVKARFTADEWTAFTHDVLYLERTVGCRGHDRRGRCLKELNDSLYQQMINDHGFNGTTAWVLFARPLTWVPVEYLKVLGYLDVVLLAGAFGLVFWAWGTETAVWTLLFLVVTYSTRWPYLGCVFLRYDWIALLLSATALLKKGYPLAAGALTGVSATLRLFPTFFMWGPFCKGVYGLTRRVVDRRMVLLAAGFFLAVLVVQGAATLRLGSAAVSTHFVNMMEHNSADELSSRRIGLALALAVPPWLGTGMPALITQELKDVIHHEQAVRYAIALAGMTFMGFALRRRSDEESFGFGFLPFFLFTTASYYYYVARMPMIPLHAGDLASLRNRVCLAYLFGLELFSNAAEHYYEGHRLFLISYLAWGLVGYFLLSMGWILWEDRAAPAAPAAVPAEPTPASLSA